MGKVKICAICQNNNPNLRYMAVPKNAARLKKWSDLLNGNVKITTSSIVCEKHFLREHLIQNDLTKTWRLSKRAIPTFNLKPTKLFDAKDLDSGSMEYIKFPKQCFNTIIDNQIKYGDEAKLCAFVTVTQNFMVYSVSCLYCDATFSLRDWEDFSWHVSGEHRNDIKTFNELGILGEATTFDIGVDEEEAIISNCIDSIDLPLSLNENCLVGEMETLEEQEFMEKFELEKLENICETVESSKAKLRQAILNNLAKTERQLTAKKEEEMSIKQWKWDADKNVWQTNLAKHGLVSLFDMETTESALVHKLINALKAYPPLWFMNFHYTKENRTLILYHYKNFSDTFQLDLSQSEVQDCILKINDWYKKIYEAGNFQELPHPQNEYYQKLMEFLPDQKDGKTCPVCKLIYQDHFQYFGHLRLKHIEVLNEMCMQTTENPFAYLKEHASEYICVRYPRYVSFSYKCQICQWSYRQKHNFLEHIKTYLYVREHVCDICGKTFSKIQVYNKHKRRHLGSNRILCQICNKDFDSFKLLTIHRTRFHRPLEGTIEQIAEVNGKRKVVTLHTSRRFLTCKDGNKCYYVCRICKQRYKHKSGVHHHYRRIHMQSKVNENGHENANENASENASENANQNVNENAKENVNENAKENNENCGLIETSDRVQLNTLLP